MPVRVEWVADQVLVRDVSIGQTVMFLGELSTSAIPDPSVIGSIYIIDSLEQAVRLFGDSELSKAICEAIDYGPGRIYAMGIDEGTFHSTSLPTLLNSLLDFPVDILCPVHCNPNDDIIRLFANHSYVKENLGYITYTIMQAPDNVGISSDFLISPSGFFFGLTVDDDGPLVTFPVVDPGTADYIAFLRDHRSSVVVPKVTRQNNPVDLTFRNLSVANVSDQLVTNLIYINDDIFDPAKYVIMTVGNLVINQSSAGQYINHMAHSYAGLVASLTPPVSPTNKKLLSRPKELLSASDLSTLANYGYTATKWSASKESLVYLGVTGTEYDYKSFVNLRITQYVINTMKYAVEPMIGELLNTIKLNEKVRNTLERIKSLKYIIDYSFRIDIDRLRGEATITLEIVPIFEVTAIQVALKLLLRTA